MIVARSGAMPEVDQAAASRRGVEMRQRRARLKKELRAIGGQTELLQRTAVKENAGDEELTLRITDFLRTLRGVGDRHLGDILVDTGISPRKRLGGLGPRQRERLIEVVNRYENGE